MIGILLAGGAATRLPNKPLLPQKNLKPVCFSGVDYLLRHKVDYIAVVIPPSSVLVDVITSYYSDTRFVFVHQPEPSGVGDAINLVQRSSLAMVVMADNIYPETEHVPMKMMTQSPSITVRSVPAWRAAHLVRVSEYGGVLTRSRPGRLALSTPWLLEPVNNHFSKEAWEDFSRYYKMGTTEKLFHQVELPGKDWWDVGTPDTYAAYWRS
jgi:hypothetical protein